MPIYLEYYFWLVSVSLVLLVLERVRPWRPQQEAVREDLVQDLFWMVFNQHYVGWMLALIFVNLVSFLDGALANLGLPTLRGMDLISSWPLWAQVGVAFVIKDFIEWYTHRLLHTVPWMWHFHKLHHSIEKLDWLGAFRSHWFELFIHRTFSFIPIIVLGASNTTILIITVITMVVQQVSHSNLKLHIGPLRHLVNSPRYHAWHHDLKMHGKHGQNFAISLTIWDRMFGNSYWPEDKEQPEKLGFHGMSKYPKSLIGRLLYPFVKLSK